MYVILKSQLNGKPFLVLPLDNERDIVRTQEWLADMKLSAELFLEQPSGLPVQWSSEEIKRHNK